MKLNISTIAFLGCIAIFGLTNCQSNQQRIENAKEDVVEANQDLEQALIDSAEYMQYKKESELKLEKNDQRIADLKAQMKAEKKDINDDYQAKVNKLEQQNSEMKRKLSEFKGSTQDKWANFKSELKKDMDGLEKALKEFAGTDE